MRGTHRTAFDRMERGTVHDARTRVRTPLLEDSPVRCTVYGNARSRIYATVGSFNQVTQTDHADYAVYRSKAFIPVHTTESEKRTLLSSDRDACQRDCGNRTLLTYHDTLHRDQEGGLDPH